MSDLTIQFDDLPLITINGIVTGQIDGVADIDMRSAPHDWEVVSVRLNGWAPQARKPHFVTIGPDDNWFLEIANALVVHPAWGSLIEQKLADLYGKPSAYDRSRDAREAA